MARSKNLGLSNYREPVLERIFIGTPLMMAVIYRSVRNSDPEASRQSGCGIPQSSRI